VEGFRLRLRLSVYLNWLIRVVTAALGVGLAVGLDHILPPLPAIAIATVGYVAIDLLVVDRVVKGMLLEKGQRRLLDQAAETLANDIGMAALAASLSRRDEAP
jgi:hypothetical protein